MVLPADTSVLCGIVKISAQKLSKFYNYASYKTSQSTFVIISCMLNDRQIDDTRAVELARIALSDRAPTVRYWAIGLFASTLDPKYVAELQQHKLSIPKDADVVNKAVETINRKNASFFISSGHPAEGMATIQWVIDKPDTNRHSNKAKFKYDVEEFIERFSPEVVPDLQRILGPLYK